MKTTKRMFWGHYIDWREKRIKKITSILGDDFFKGKKILELGCGWGDIGLYFRQKGANITFADARAEHLEHVKEHSPDSTIHQIDQDQQWNLDKKFDLIIHTGVLYHLTNWKQDLLTALEHADLMVLETVVANNSSDDFEYSRDEEGFDQSIHKKATIPSAAYIEKVLIENGATFTRYDDSELNSKTHLYDWTVNNTSGQGEKGQKMANYRRFWIIKK